MKQVKMSSVLRELLNKLSSVIASNCKEGVLKSLKSENELARQSTRAEYGDICIPRGIIALAFPTPQQVESVKNSILNTNVSLLPLPILSCSSCENGFISIRLHRAASFRCVIGEVLQEAERYGHHGTEGEVVLITSLSAEIVQKKENAERNSLAVLRQQLVHQHVAALLEANGFALQKVQGRMKSAALGKLLGEENQGYLSATCSTCTSEETEEVHPKMERELLKSKFVTSVACQTDMSVDESQSSVVSCSNAPSQSEDGVKSLSKSAPDLSHCYHLDIAAVIKDQQLRTGKGGYSQNLAEVQLTNVKGEATTLLQECFKLQHVMDKVKAKTSSDSIHVLHVAPSSQEFMLQQLDVSLRGLSVDFRQLPQYHLPCAPVRVTANNSADCGARPHNDSLNKMDAEAFYAIRESQMREASILKYGDQVKGDKWDIMIQTLTAAGIKFDILGTHFRHEVKLDVGSCQASNPWRDNRNGVFVVYNYARLSGIFKRFEEEVQSGTYPPLPSVEDVDFSTLREEVEWKLLFSHILTFPDVVSGSLQDGFTSHDFCCKFETQKVCRFLISLSQDLSAYYSRFRILVEPRDHLLPIIYARLYLLKAVHQVLANGLALLRIMPLAEM